jgi:hypothetical protein
MADGPTETVDKVKDIEGMEDPEEKASLALAEEDIGGGGIFRNGGNISTGTGLWNNNMSLGAHDYAFSIDDSGMYHENDTTYPVKVYANQAPPDFGSQMKM